MITILQELISIAMLGAEDCMTHYGKANPVALMMDGDRKLTALEGRYSMSEEEKDEFSERVRDAVHKHHAVATVMVFEGWVVRDAVTKVDPSIRPSLSPHREEVVAIIAEDKETVAHIFMLIVRGDHGQFVRFEQTEPIVLPKNNNAEMVGRFANML